MIVVSLMGGLANQMFGYAIGRRLALKRNTRLKLDLITYFENQPSNNTPRNYELDCYQIVAEKASPADLLLFSETTAIPKNTLKNLLGLEKKYSTYTEPNQSFHPEVLKLPNNTYLNGYWQNEKYFTNIRGHLLREFFPKQKSNYTKKVLKEIDEGSVAVHVRRGDYVLNKYANKFHGLAPVEYYHAAAAFIEKRSGPMSYFVFSDDIAWCKKNLIFGGDTLFVEGKGRHASEDIYLMQQCSHNIIANSSFSWWGAWLNQNADKIVVAPKQWFQDSEADKKIEIVPKTWIRL